LIKEIEKPINNLKLLENYKKILVLLQPVIPHFALECLVEIDSKYKAEWPLINLNLIKKEMFNIVIQINGKKRGLLVCESETTEEQLIGKIKTDEDIHKFIMDKKIKKSIYITNKLINLITE
jgi:leucyl-tRNA synthetase